jgi:hypothetical protein
MTKSRNHKEVEDYLGIIRQQKAEIKSLKRRIKRLEKDLLLNEDDEEESDAIEYEMCEACGKGIIQVLDLGIKQYKVCSICKDRNAI